MLETMVRIQYRIDHLENVPDNVQIYVRDKELNIYHDLRESQYDSI